MTLDLNVSIPCEQCSVYLNPEYDPRDCEDCIFSDDSLVYESN